MGVLPAFAVPSKCLGPAENSQAFDLASIEPFFFSRIMDQHQNDQRKTFVW